MTKCAFETRKATIQCTLVHRVNVRTCSQECALGLQNRHIFCELSELTTILQFRPV